MCGVGGLGWGVMWRRLVGAVPFVLLGVAVGVGGWAGWDVWQAVREAHHTEAATSGTVAAPATITATTTSATTSTAARFVGIRLLVPDGCDGCDVLSMRLMELARGEVPIQVVAAPAGEQRPTVQVVALDGSVVEEWKGVEVTTSPAVRASAENAEAMIRAACDAIGTCPPDMTSTTVPADPSLVLRPNDFACGMLVERRYSFDGVRPAPLGVIWRLGSNVVVGSAILVGYGKAPSFPVQDYADFCFGDDDNGNPIVVRFWITGSEVVVGWLTSTGTDLLPFGNSAEANSLMTRTRDEGIDWAVGRLVIGRQYVFDLSTNVVCLDVDESGNYITVDCPFDFDNVAVIRYLTGQTSAPPEKPGMICLWYGMPGSI
jgi:hypothetical protein